MAEDQRLTEIEEEREQELTDLEKDYTGRIDESDEKYNEMIDNVDTWAETQKEIQTEQTEFLEDKINQKKDQAHKDYIKEQSGAYVDWQRQSNPYGVEAEKLAAAGLSTATGYKGTLQVSMYNTYQNRVATARESYNQAILEYDNSIKEAWLQNNAALAEIAQQALEKKLTLGLQSLQYRNQLLDELTTQQTDTKQLYDNKWKAMLDQINTEKAMEEQKRQFDAEMAEKQRQFNESMAFQREQAAGGSGSVGGGGSSSNSARATRIFSEIDETRKAAGGKTSNYTGITGTISSKAASAKSAAACADYLDSLVASGKITEDEADTLYSRYLSTPLTDRSWTVVHDGGTNWMWGIDNNAQIKDNLGNTYRLDDLVDSLVKSGMSKKEAKSWVKAKQKELGI